MRMIPLLLAAVFLSPGGRAAEVRLSDTTWTHQPSWLQNPAASFDVEKTTDGLRFLVGAGGRGMKWNARLPQPVDLAKAPWVVFRYRAKDAVPPIDYLLFLGGDQGQEQNVVPPSDLIADGAWHTVVAKARPFTAAWMAVQLQTLGSSAEMEVSRIEFREDRPKLAMADLLSMEAATKGEFQPVRFERNADHARLLDALNAVSWFESAEIAVSGVPFELAEGLLDVACTEADKPSEIRLPLSGAAGNELFLLIDSNASGVVSEPHQFSARVIYADGPADECVPGGIGGGFGLRPGIGVYVVPLDSGRKVKEVVLRENVSGAVAYLVGATVGLDTRLAPGARPSPNAAPQTLATHKPAVGFRFTERSREALRLSDGRTEVTLRLRPGVSIEARPSGAEGITFQGSLWKVRIGDRELESADFIGGPEDRVEGYSAVDLRDRKGLGIRGRLHISPWQPGTIDLRLELESKESRRVTVTFPAVPDIRGRGELSYCFPCRGAVVNEIPIELKAPYSGLMPLQFADVCARNAGVYILTRDLVDTYRYFCLKKESGAASMAVEYLEQEIGPGKGFGSISTVIGFHDGDWHAALDAYKDWVAGWYKPDASRKDWFRRIFNFRQQFLRFYIPGGEHYYDKKSGTYSFATGIAEDEKVFGGVDYLHLFDWGASSKYGRTGDYEPWDEIGGVDAFRKAIDVAQNRDIPVGLYLEGYLIDPPSRVAQAHGKEWEILDANGKPLGNFAPAMNMCPAVTGWQEYLSAVYARVREQTRAKGYYCDEMGFADPGHFCYAKNHGHPVPDPGLAGQGQMMRRIRAAIGPDSALYTEETPVDVNTQHQDGSFTYNIASTPDGWSPSHINLARFALPDFKTFEIINCDRPLADRLTSVKQIFFNGEGIWLEGPPEWFAPEMLGFIRKMHSVMREYADCFTSLKPVPLVPTGNRMVFANEFPGSEQTLWTLFNANYATVRGDLLAVPHKSGARYYDAWSGRELSPRLEGKTAYLTLALGPRDVGCIIRR